MALLLKYNSIAATLAIFRSLQSRYLANSVSDIGAHCARIILHKRTPALKKKEDQQYRNKQHVIDKIGAAYTQKVINMTGMDSIKVTSNAKLYELRKSTKSKLVSKYENLINSNLVREEMHNKPNCKKSVDDNKKNSTSFKIEIKTMKKIDLKGEKSNFNRIEAKDLGERAKRNKMVDLILLKDIKRIAMSRNLLKVQSKTITKAKSEIIRSEKKNMTPKPSFSESKFLKKLLH